MKSNKMIEQIRILKAQNFPIRKIAKSLSISRNTVRRYLRDDENQNEIMPSETVKKVKCTSLWQRQYDWDEIIKQSNSGKTALQLYREYSPPVIYMTFARIITTKKKKPIIPSLNLLHVPGEKAQVDFSTGIEITDPITGKKTQTHLFCGVLPFSSYSFACFVFDQKKETFIQCHEKMWNFFGGVTSYVVLDNLKSGVSKAHRYDPELNATYCAYANHAGFAGLPTRPYSPKDKAAVECAIGVLKKTFYQEVSNEIFYNIQDLNKKMKEFLEKFNAKVMKNYGVSRAERFNTESPILKPLPTSTFELFDWKHARVHPDCCIQFDKNFYSVPFKYCGQQVKIRSTKTTIEIFNSEHQSISHHIRVYGIGISQINDNHFPDIKMQNSRFEIQSAIKKASQIGPKFHEYIAQQFNNSHPLKHLRRVQGIMRFIQNIKNNNSIEYGASQALTFNKMHSSFFRKCVEYHLVGGSLTPLETPKRDNNHLYLR